MFDSGIVSPPRTLISRRSLTAGATVADTPSRKEGNVRSRIVLLVGALILALSIVGIGTALAASSMPHAKAKAAMATKKKAMFTG